MHSFRMKKVLFFCTVEDITPKTNQVKCRGGGVVINVQNFSKSEYNKKQTRNLTNHKKKGYSSH